jgi:hypothetical protein
VNWHAFALQLEGVHYETLRKAITGQRHPSPAVIEQVATALALQPSYFLEYRLHEARRELDPAVVSLEQAANALSTWQRARAA